MKCPIDGTELAITHRDSIEIDYCPQCRGVWLDRGELDKLIERSSEREGSMRYEEAQSYSPKRKNDDYDDHYEDRYYDGDERHKYPRGRKRKSFLGEMFDIFD